MIAIMAKDKYTVTQAVQEVLKEMMSGEELVGYKLYNRVIRKMSKNGSDKRPLDSTVLRLVREHGERYGVKAKAQGVSVYIKDRLF